MPQIAITIISLSLPLSCSMFSRLEVRDDRQCHFSHPGLEAEVQLWRSYARSMAAGHFWLSCSPPRFPPSKTSRASSTTCAPRTVKETQWNAEPKNSSYIVVLPCVSGLFRTDASERAKTSTDALDDARACFTTHGHAEDNTTRHHQTPPRNQTPAQK